MKKNITIGVLVFIFLFYFFPNTNSSKVETYQEEKVNKNNFVSNPTTKKYVDNFDKGRFFNMLGGYIHAEHDSIILEYVGKPEAWGGEGYSLKITNISKNINSKVIIDLNRLDVSASKGLTFWIKGKTGKETFNLILTDWKGSKDKFSSKDLLDLSNDWQKVTIKKSNFKNIDFNFLDKLKFEFMYPQKQILFLDEVLFFGPPDMFFYSIKDNLKGFPDKKILDTQEILKLCDKELLKRIVSDTWKYFDQAIDKRHNLICDYIDMNPKSKYRIGDYTSTTNLGLYLISVISAFDLGFIEKKDAINRINDTFRVISNLEKWNNQWYNFYSTTNLQVTRPYVSSVDNGWLAAGLIVTRQTFPKELGKKATVLLEKIDFSLLYDSRIGQLYLGYEADKDVMSSYHYGMIATEPRIASFIAIGKNDVPKHHWFKIYRTLPENWDWQRQIPKGKYKNYMGIDVFSGYYIYNDIKVVPSWGGSMFEALMPTLVLDEEKYAPDSFGLNNVRVAKIHRDFMLYTKKYPVWGLSPCSTPEGGYEEFGVAEIGARGYENYNIVTPHASILALPYLTEDVIKNIRTLIEKYDIYGEYGLYDAVDVKTGEISYKYLCLNQAMIFIQINNFINNGIIRQRFHSDPIAQKAVKLLEIESFF